MKNKTVGIVLSLLIIFFVAVWAQTRGLAGSTSVDVGSMTLSYRKTIEVQQPLTATTTITDGRFDSFDLPLGTSFIASATREFIIGGFTVNSSATDIRIDYGFGDTHVENSVGAPTNAVTQGSFVIQASAGLERVPVFVKVPVGKIPFVRVVGDASNGHITIIGVPE